MVKTRAQTHKAHCRRAAIDLSKKKSSSAGKKLAECRWGKKNKKNKKK